MLGRGIDQVMACPSDPTLHERWVGDARRYVELAESASGSIARRVPAAYVWGDALGTLRSADARIINLETAVCTSSRPWPDKGIHYRMHPAHVDSLRTAEIDICALANNHVLDWGRTGLTETLESLRAAGISTCGAGHDLPRARAPTMAQHLSGARVLVLSRGAESSGIPRAWGAGHDRAGVALFDPSDPTAVDEITAAVIDRRQAGDVVVASLHWGGNWGYRIDESQRRFARALIDEAGVDVVHGHSSHHPLGIEIYRGRPIIYGSGDLINDYEGIGGHEELRPGLGLIYLPLFELDSAIMTGMQLEAWQVHRFRLVAPSDADVDWLTVRLARESRTFGTSIERIGAQRLRVGW